MFNKHNKISYIVYIVSLKNIDNISRANIPYIIFAMFYYKRENTYYSVFFDSFLYIHSYFIQETIY